MSRKGWIVTIAISVFVFSWIVYASMYDYEPQRFGYDEKCVKIGECKKTTCSGEGGAIAGAIIGGILTGGIGAVVGAVVGDSVENKDCVTTVEECCVKKAVTMPERQEWIEWNIRQKERR